MSPEIVSEPRALTAPVPYVGPRPFDEDDRASFSAAIGKSPI